MRTRLLGTLFLFAFSMHQASAQCSTVNLNWDYLSYFPSAGISTYTTLARSQSQKFALGTQKVTITHNFTGSNAVGENVTNTAEAGSYGTGADIQFTGNGVISYTFDNAVQNVKFSVYDIDVNQKVQVTALNSGSPVNVTMAKVSGTTLTIAGSGTTTASATASSTKVGNSTTDATINVDIAGPVTGFTITVTLTGSGGGEDGSFWISDLAACSPGTFTTGYFSVSTPFAGQPGYVIAVRDNNVYYVNPANGKARFIFQDAGHTNLNSLAYDPVNHFLYYVYSLTGSGGSTNPANKALRRYDYNMDTLGIVINDITTLLPTFEAGVESGAAAFYDGSLYLGIEANSGGTNKSIVWKVDFDASFAPVAASEVWAIDGGSHDWADIGVSNGVLYDFDGSTTGADFYHMNLLSHAVTNYAPAAGLTPRQTAVDYTDQVYNLGAPSTGTTGVVAAYNYNGSINTVNEKTITYRGVSVTGSWGDAAEAFKPKVDYGDGPSTYDPGVVPAMHEKDTSLMLGSSVDNEWSTRGQTTLANSDNFDNSLSFVPVFNPTAGTYLANVVVYNNSGVAATLVGWLDFNGNGVFDVSEGLAVSVSSGSSPQTIPMFWGSAPSTLANGSYTYLRLRLTESTNGMTVSTPTGWYGMGEVEDYRVPVNSMPLTGKLLSFDANKTPEEQVIVEWTASCTDGLASFDVQRSADGRNWQVIGQLKADRDGEIHSYNYLDRDPLKGYSYYRIQLKDATSTYYSPTQKILINTHTTLEVRPNPITNRGQLSIRNDRREPATVRIFDMAGRQVYERNLILEKGILQLDISFASLWKEGLYPVQVQTATGLTTEKIMIQKQQ
jgi:hypothetical protein